MKPGRARWIGVVVLAGCSLAPPKPQPEPAVPASWPVGDAYLRNSEATLPKVDYRDLFHDARLQALIARAIDNNQDVRLAVANIAAARGQLRVQRAQQFPQIGVAASASRADRGTAVSGSASGFADNFAFDVGLSAFEIDLFGRVRSLGDAAQQTLFGTEAALRAARLSLVAEVASAYLTLATDRSLLAIAKETEDTATRSVQLTEARRAGGVAPRSDVRQAETVLATARADRAAQTTLVAQDRNALELLVGAPVADSDLAESIESVDGSFDEVPAGLDSRVLLRRPDVVQAEYQLYAANARIGAARAAFFPTISLTAAAGFASGSLTSLFTRDAFAWSAGPALSLPIFDAGARRGNLETVEAQRDAALAQYQKTIQTAFREVADALARRGTIDDQMRAQADLEAAARDSYFLADARYREGVDPFLSSLDAQRTLYTARRSLASIRRLRADNLVELYRALGGSS
jgi:multidrug efflux system outer membrane protein